MPSYSGTYVRISVQGLAAQPGTCRVEFDDEGLTLVPESGPPTGLDLGDIDELRPGEYELLLKLYTGESILLSRFGKSFQNLFHDLRESRSKRLIQCLLLEDLEEIERFEGTADLTSPEGGFSAPAELRLYRSNLAVLPQDQTGLQWRLAEIDAVVFDNDRYAVVLRSGDELLTLTRLAKRTREFMDRLKEAMNEVANRSAVTVRSVFPFLTPDEFRSVAELLREGRVAPLSRLAAVHPRTGQALSDKIVVSRLKPYYDFLMERASVEGAYAGFRLIRKDEELPAEDTKDAETPDPVQGQEAALPDLDGGNGTPPDSGGEPGDMAVLHWFIIPLRTPRGGSVPRVAAWETTSRSGRATYFFNLISPDAAGGITDPQQAAAIVDREIRRLNRVLQLLNFRREPIYVPDDALEMQLRYRRYAIACRKIPELRRLRSSFLGRALHTSSLLWQQQVERILSGG